MMYATTVGRELAMASVMMAPEADQVKISICPGVSTSIYLRVSHQHSRKGAKSWIPYSLDCLSSLFDEGQNLVELGRE